MSSELTIEGVNYISSKRASEISGYSQDYVGQLARAGKVLGKRVGGLWYVVAESLSRYKDVAEAYIPTPPSAGIKRTSEDSSIVTLEGKTYVSAARAAKLTLYHQDYIGQLARGGKILSRQVGKRWYVDLDVLKAHKKEKDSLLGAVQSSSVGIEKGDSTVIQSILPSTLANDKKDVSLHYTYKADPYPLLPEIDERVQQNQGTVNSKSAGVEHHIPIRVLRTAHNNLPIEPISSTKFKKGAVRMSVISILLRILSVSTVSLIVIIAYNFSLSSLHMPVLKLPSGIQKISFRGNFGAIDLREWFGGTLSKKIHYSRE